MGHYTELSADVTGVKILTISIDACGNYGWGACAWCEPTLYYGVEEGEIRITSPLKEIERTVAGNQNLDVTGFVLGVEKVKGLVNGKFIGTAEVQSDGTFTLTVKARNLELGRNTLTISPLNAEGKSAETVIVKENKINVVSVPWDSTAGDIITKGGSLTSRCDKLSIGSQVHQTNNGFCVKPGETEEDYADVVIDLTTRLWVLTTLHPSIITPAEALSIRCSTAKRCLPRPRCFPPTRPLPFSATFPPPPRN